jgi:hypothetical protein
MTLDSSREDEHEHCEFIRRKLEESGYQVFPSATVAERQIDLLAKKDGKSLAIEIKTTKDRVLDSIPSLVKLKILPEIDFVYIAAPKAVLTKDIVTIADYRPIGIGLIGITDDEIEWSLKPQETAPARLAMTGYETISRIFPGETFNIKAYFGNPGQKISRKIEVECRLIGPFTAISEQTQRIEDLQPGDRVAVGFMFKAEQGADPGKYFVFLKWVDQTKQESTMIDIEIKTRSSEYIERLVSETISELDNVLSKNLQKAVMQIDDAIENGYVNIEDHIYDKSIWNTLGMAYLNHGLLEQAEYVYRNMLSSLEKYEVTHPDKKIHKGMAFHNLGTILYRQGKRKEAKEMFLKAFEEDKRTHGLENASKGQAKRALDELDFGPAS